MREREREKVCERETDTVWQQLTSAVEEVERGRERDREIER